MFYVASKILWFFFQPSTFLVLLGFAGLVLSLTRLRRWGRRLAGLAILGLLIGGLSPLGQMLMLPLEERFPVPDLNGLSPAGVIVLGGSYDTRVSAARGVVAINEAGERVTAMIAMINRFPGSKIVFTGGGGDGVLEGDMSESDVTVRLLQLIGLHRDRVILETRSLNTWQNALYTKQLVKPQHGEQWLLITSAAHMPRAIGSFRKAGFAVTAYPVDFRTQGAGDGLRPFKSVSEGLRRVDAAMREWTGLAVYWITGRTSSFFPKP